MIEKNPLLEMQRASIERGICDDQGRRLTGAPWAFSLAEIIEGLPFVRTIGFQRISELGLDWLTLRPKQDFNPVAICYTEGIYPPPTGETCEQWRAEGQLTEIPISNVLETVPIGSFAQILAVGRLKQTTHEHRVAMENKSGFLEEVSKIKKDLESGTADMVELESSVRVARLMPDRMELLVSGPIWERFEWKRTEKEWSNMTRLMPY